MENNEKKETVVAENAATKQETSAPENAKKAPREKGKRPFAKRERKVEVKEYEERVVAINRVCKTVKGGRRMKFSALVVVGNGKGKYGFGTGKSSEVPDAIKKAVDQAKRNISTIRMVGEGSIPHEVVGQFGATKVFLKPAPAGTGIIAGGAVRAILELSGVKNVYSKVYGSRTAINVIRATNDAIINLKNYKSVKALRSKEDATDVK